MKLIYNALRIIAIAYFIIIPILFIIGKISLSEFISLVGVLPLAAIALFQEHFKRWFFAPKLEIELSHEEPYSIRTPMTDSAGKFVCYSYYFRFRVYNSGKSQARLCEAIIEEFSEYDKNRWIKSYTFQPVNLIWSNDKSKDEFLNINPGARWFCDIGSIDQQNNIFWFYVRFRPNSQPKILSEGLRANQKCKIKIALYSENASKVTREFTIEWSGKWMNESKDMFKEIVIR